MSGPSHREYLMTCPSIMIPLVVSISSLSTSTGGENDILLKPHGTGFAINGFEFSRENTRDSIIVTHRPKDAQVAQLYRIPSDPDSTDTERLSFFDIGSGRTIQSFTPILGEDWRGAWRAGGALMVMDLTGNENFQLWYETRAPFSFSFE